MRHRLPAELLAQLEAIPIYKESCATNDFRILEKPEIAERFPENWMTPRLSDALKKGDAEFVLSTGTNHARMQLIRPPYFLLNSYYKIWADHPDIGLTWRQNCPRISLTTVLATEHVVRTNARASGLSAPRAETLEARRLDSRTFYLNTRLDPALWAFEDIDRMLEEMAQIRRLQSDGHYHLDCSGYHLVHFINKLEQLGRRHEFAPPASIVHAYEFMPHNVKRFLRGQFDCPIVDLFGSTELGYLYYTDREGRYIACRDQVDFELVPIVPSSTIYSLIVTSLRNPYMPLIRYRSGDCVRTTDGSPDPDKVARICGREKEMLEIGGRIVCQADLDDWIAASCPEIFLYQLRMTGTREAELRYTTFDGAPVAESLAVDLVRRIAAECGLGCKLDHRKHIAIGRSGKYRWLAKYAERDSHDNHEANHAS